MSLSDGSCLTMYLSNGERPVNLPVSTAKAPLSENTPSLFFISCSFISSI